MTAAFDFDGTIVDTLPEAMRVAADILSLFGERVCFERRDEMKAQFDLTSLVTRFGAQGFAVSQMHPIVMRERLRTTRGARAFPGMDQLLKDLERPATIITAGYASTASCVLDGLGIPIAEVIGREAGSKTEALARWASTIADPLFVCDTVTDVMRCLKVGVPSVAVEWGYDDASELLAAGCGRFVRSAAELREALDLIDPEDGS
jgi:phosphoglycolate phosphatase-like HAD superfamily hydrolase